ncbi:unnamed protein product [Heligmosomoides polygyrus]|uniref:Uncharacterized protein n=1 Tax=Heligmosomoides polygyrus TaxID=6339 RepID=A0A183F807_HELPZ|nr:unnamed protein product [Heligmosomoides polygyrus]
MRVMTLTTRSDALLSTTSPTPPRNLLTTSVVTSASATSVTGRSVGDASPKYNIGLNRTILQFLSPLPRYWQLYDRIE